MLTAPSPVKDFIVDTLARVPSYRAQRLIAPIVRHVWRGFSEA